MKVYYFRHIEINKRNQLTVKIINKAKPFADFEDYYNHLRNAMRTMSENAQDSNRKYKYGVVTMISKGMMRHVAQRLLKKLDVIKRSHSAQSENIQMIAE